MITEISQYLQNHIQTLENDAIIFKNKLYQIDKDNFTNISSETQPITFIDGGQAEIISSANFCVTFIRVVAVEYPSKKISKKEFYLVTTAQSNNNEIYYQSKIFGDSIINEQDLYLSSEDSTIKTGRERAGISTIANIARRFAELSLASNYQHVLLDGSLDMKYKNEETYMKSHLASVAKSSSLFTSSGNSPVVLLNSIGPEGTWKYEINNETSFVRLHESAKHVFRFDGNKSLLSSLISNSKDALFLGYPYGLILADQLARVSNSEKESLRMKFLLNKDNEKIVKYLQTSNAHSILDSLSF